MAKGEEGFLPFEVQVSRDRGHHRHRRHHRPHALVRPGHRRPACRR
ncbi:MAG: hypothetical protein JWP41_1096, partial [Ramlibacter sp.]|nr:hypothetical protein [Ramlibacter sp.]